AAAPRDARLLSDAELRDARLRHVGRHDHLVEVGHHQERARAVRPDLVAAEDGALHDDARARRREPVDLLAFRRHREAAQLPLARLAREPLLAEVLLGGDEILLRKRVQADERPHALELLRLRGLARPLDVALLEEVDESSGPDRDEPVALPHALPEERRDRLDAARERSEDRRRPRLVERDARGFGLDRHALGDRRLGELDEAPARRPVRDRHRVSGDGERVGLLLLAASRPVRDHRRQDQHAGDPGDRRRAAPGAHGRPVGRDLGRDSKGRSHLAHGRGSSGGAATPGSRAAVWRICRAASNASASMSSRSRISSWTERRASRTSDIATPPRRDVSSIVWRTERAFASATSSCFARDRRTSRWRIADSSASFPDARTARRSSASMDAAECAAITSAWPRSSTGSGTCTPSARLFRWFPDTTNVSYV